MYNAIAINVSRADSTGSQIFPVVMSENYEAQPTALVDDRYPIVIYHKILNKKYGLNAAQFGPRNKQVNETVLVKMVVYAKYSAIKMTKEQLEALITANFPDDVDAALYLPYKFINMDVAMQSSNFTSEQVWAEEYRNVPYPLAPEDIYFSITYTLNTIWRKGCFQICDCE
jgi:hypothetical protein